jgi:hypothetical protein
LASISNLMKQSPESNDLSRLIDGPKLFMQPSGAERSQTF